MPSHNRSLFADFCKKRGQTSIVLELGYKFWVCPKGSFLLPLRLIFCKGNGALTKKKRNQATCKIASLWSLIPPINFVSGTGFCFVQLLLAFLNFRNFFSNFMNFLNLAEGASSHAFFYVLA